MQLRKLQLTGGSSYTVTLPKEWVENAKLSAGDVVGLVTQPDGSLGVLAHARGGSIRKRFDIEATEAEESVFRSIVAAYLSGYDVITVRSKKALTPAMRRAIRNASRRIVGIEVVEEDVHAVTLQDFMDPREFRIDKGLRRMEALTRAMQEDALRAFADPALEIPESFGDRDDEVDRLHWMVNKQYHALLRDPEYAQKIGLNAGQALNYLLVARIVERTADHARRIAENLRALRETDVHAKIESKIEKQARRAFQLFSDASASFHRKDPAAANALIEQAEAFQSAQEALIRESLSLGGEEILHIAYALESIARTAAYAADIAEVAINHQVAMA